MIKIHRARLYQYQLPLVECLSLKQIELHTREGIIVELLDDNGRLSYGDAAPLPGFSQESLGACTAQLINALSTLCPEAIDLEAFFDQETSGSLFPSVAFALEGALYGLTVPVAEPAIPVAPLLSGSQEKIGQRLTSWGTNWPREFKLKVGRYSLPKDVERVNGVLSLLPPHVKLRLDANRCWYPEDVRQFAQGIPVERISYLEEPVAQASNFPGLSDVTGLPYALDETVQEPGYVFQKLPGLAAIIIKPTLVGGVRRCRELATKASLAGVRTVFSSAFESSLGVSRIAQLSHELSPGEEPGLDTLSAFTHPLCQELPGTGESLPQEALELMELSWEFCPARCE